MLNNPTPVNATLELILQIGSGFFWTLTYILILRRGFKDKAYGMPVVALCANIAWEFTFSFIFPHPKPQLYINYIWLLFDVGILGQYLIYGKIYFTPNLPRHFFYPAFILALVLSALTIILMSYEFNEFIGIYAAFAQNLLMSGLFITMLLKRNNSKGQSVYIALFKLIGTLFPSILFYHYFPHSYLLMMLYIAILIYDFIYLWLLHYKIKLAGVNPWLRL